MKNNCLYCYGPLAKNRDFHTECAQAFFGTTAAPEITYSLAQIDELARQVVLRSIAIPGVQAKLSMSMIKKSRSKAATRLTIVGALGGQYILKPPDDRYPEMPANEHLTMKLANIFGIQTVPATLVRFASGELAFLTKRVDRGTDGSKIHMLDMFQITEATDKYKSSTERIAKAIASYASNTLLDQLFFFERLVFAFLTGNNDMHLKNFSLIKSATGWALSPAYDLVNVSLVLPDDTEELALPMMGKKSKLKKQDFEQFASNVGLNNKQISSVFRRFSAKKTAAVQLIRKSFLSDTMQENYIGLLLDRFARLGM